ncbi:MAG: hypothetical protein K2M48_00875 [Clostridiales bacterium]|nr:hypothetical protein [Clostridiales bacterium]
MRDIEIPYSAMQYYYIGMRLPRGFCICDKRGKCLTSILAANAPIRTKLIQILEEKAVLPISPDELNRLIKANTNKVLRSRNNTIAMSIISAFFVAVALVILFLPTSRDSYYDVSGTVESFKTVNNTGSLYEFTLEDDDSRYELDKYAILYFDGDPETVLSKGSEVKLKIIRSYVDGRRFVSYIECDGKVYLSTADYEDALNEYYDILSYIFFAISGICIGVSIYFFVSYAKSKRKR